MTYPCRICGARKPEKEVVTIFSVYGKNRVRFKSCLECRRLARVAYQQKKKEKYNAQILH